MKIIQSSALKTQITQKNFFQTSAIIDVRTPAEFQEGHIKGAINLELDLLTGNEAIFQENKHLYFICKGGIRAKKACDKLVHILEKLEKDVFALEGGMDAWNKNSCPINIQTNRRFSVMQQMQIIIGLGAFIGSLLALTVNIKFAYIPLFFGGGLAFAGFTGICMLLRLLSKMPWNK